MSAQEALKISLAGEKAARLRRLALEQSTATTHWGNLQMNFNGRIFTEFNDNITLLQVGPLSDIILRAQVGLEAKLPVSTHNQLELSLSGGYAKYIENPGFDRPYLLPNSRLGFDLFLTPFRLTFEDAFSYQQDSAERAVVTGTARFGGFQNLAGVTVLHDANRIKTTFAYHHLVFLSSTATFRHLDRESHLFVGRLDGEKDEVVRRHVDRATLACLLVLTAEGGGGGGGERRRSFATPSQSSDRSQHRRHRSHCKEVVFRCRSRSHPPPWHRAG